MHTARIYSLWHFRWVWKNRFDRTLITIIWNTITNDQPFVLKCMLFFFHSSSISASVSVCVSIHRFCSIYRQQTKWRKRWEEWKKSMWILIKYVLYHTEKWYGNDSSLPKYTVISFDFIFSFLRIPVSSMPMMIGFDE